MLAGELPAAGVVHEAAVEVVQGGQGLSPVPLSLLLVLRTAVAVVFVAHLHRVDQVVGILDAVVDPLPGRLDLGRGQFAPFFPQSDPLLQSVQLVLHQLQLLLGLDELFQAIFELVVLLVVEEAAGLLAGVGRRLDPLLGIVDQAPVVASCQRPFGVRRSATFWVALITAPSQTSSQSRQQLEGAPSMLTQWYLLS